jgi:hypothetical protein
VTTIGSDLLQKNGVGHEGAEDGQAAGDEDQIGHATPGFSTARVSRRLASGLDGDVRTRA